MTDLVVGERVEEVTGAGRGLFFCNDVELS
jgi:hypothetical protein